MAKIVYSQVMDALSCMVLSRSEEVGDVELLGEDTGERGNSAWQVEHVAAEEEEEPVPVILYRIHSTSASRGSISGWLARWRLLWHAKKHPVPMESTRATAIKPTKDIAIAVSSSQMMQLGKEEVSTVAESACSHGQIHSNPPSAVSIISQPKKSIWELEVKEVLEVLG